MQSRNWLLPVCGAVFFGLTTGCAALRERAAEPRIPELIAQIDEDQLIATVNKLQEFKTREFKTKRNELAGDYNPY